MKSILAIVSVLFVLVVGGAVFAPGFIDWNKYKPQIIAQLEETTGHKYEIGGSIELAVLPLPHFSIGQLSVSTPTATGEFKILELEKASAQVELIPLFSGEIIVSSVVLQKPVFQLAVGSSGTQSWMTPVLEQKMEKKQGTTGGSGIAEAIALNEITIRDGSFAYTDYRSGQKIALTGVNLTVQGDSLYGPYALQGDVIYEGHKTKVTLNSGRIDKLAESISAQLGLTFPDIASSVSYSGVVAMKKGTLDLQGETGIETPDIAALAGIIKKDAVPPAMKGKALSLKGILTLADKELAYRNVKFGFSGVEGTGYAVVKNFEKDAKGPLNVNLVLETAKPYALDKLLLPAAKAGEKKKDGFLPESFTLPREVTGAFNIKSAAVQFGGTTFQDVAFSIDSKEKGFVGQINLKGPGNTIVDINSALNFGSQSLSAQNGSMTYSDPELVLETQLTSEEPLGLAKAFVKTPISPEVTKILANRLEAQARVTVRHLTVGISDSYFKIAETRVNGKGTYSQSNNGGRDLLQLAVTNFGLDADHWMKKLASPSSAVTGAPETKTDPRKITAGISLPFDLDFAAEIQSLRFKGRDYSKFAAKGKLAGSRLSFEGFELVSNAGDTLVAAGGIRDLKTLEGIDVSLQADILDPQQTLQSFGVDAARLPPGMGKAEIIAELKGQPEKISFTTNLKAMRATLEASGAVADTLSTPKVSDLTLRLQHPSYVEMARIYNPNFNSGVAIKKNLDVFASMSRNNNVYTFSQLQAVIGPANIKGDVVADVSGPKPAITAALEFTDLPLDDLLGIRTGAKSSAVSAQPIRQTQDVRWSRDAINTSLLHKANIALKATANSVSYGNWNFKNAGINIDLRDGNADIKQFDGGLYGGQIAITGNLKSSAKERQPVSFAGNVIVQNVNLEEFVHSFSGSPLVKAKGAVSLETTLETTGLSPAALIFDLKGKGTSSGNNIVFEGFDLARLSRALSEPTSSFTENFGRLLDASMGGGTTQFDTLEGAHTISEGVIRFDKMLLSGQAADVNTLGTISLPLWSMDLESTVQLKDPADAPPLRASFKGPIDKPAQTFGQNAMQQYFMQQIQGTILGPNAGKINEQLDKIDSSGTLKNLLGVGGQAPSPQPAPAPQPQQAPLQETVPADDAAAVPPQEAAPQQAQPQKKEITPEEAMFGVIKGLLEDR